MVHTPARMGDGSTEEEPFPWYLGLFDAHCHPTDTLQGLERLPSMHTRVLTIMATREQDQELVSKAAHNHGLNIDSIDSDDNDAAECRVLPAFGWHPWFSHHMYDDRDNDEVPGKLEHYRNVLQPPPDDEQFLKDLIAPQSLKDHLARTRSYLEKHPYALIGEIGMDRAMRVHENTIEGRAVDPEPGLTPGGRENRRLSPYRIDMNHQAKILVAQLNLAGEMQRAVSVHGVAAHGFLFEILASTWKGHEKESNRKQKERRQADEREENAGPSTQNAGPKPYPPRICLHSYSGPPETLKRYLNRSIPATIFFSFSQVINFAHGSGKAVEAIKAVPDNRILVESDLHQAGERMDGLLADITIKICEVKGWDLQSGVKQLADNWKHFALGQTV